MPNDTGQQVRFRNLSWQEIVQKAWGKEWAKPEPAYEFSDGRKFDDPKEGGPYAPQDE